MSDYLACSNCGEYVGSPVHDRIAEMEEKLKAFEEIERAFEDDVGSNKQKVVAMETCLDRIRKLIEELGE